MQEKLLKEILSMLVGKSGAAIVDVLHNKKDVNEFLIAKKLNLTINQTRNVLYKLADEGLVSFIRKKDAKKGGWYIYFWTLNSGKGLERFRSFLEIELSKLKGQIHDRTNKRHYYSPLAEMEYTEEEALEYNFICPETGEVLELKEDTELIATLEREVKKLEQILEQVNIEIGSIEEKEAKSKERRIKAEQKKKDQEKEEKRILRQKERKRLKEEKEKSGESKKKAKKVPAKIKPKKQKAVKTKAKAKKKQ